MNDILTFEETRVIGSLIEKELTTPEYYPLTVNALRNACNQKSNRDPVVSFDESIIENTLDKLREKSFASRITGSDIRVPKYRQVFTEAMNFSHEEIAVICVLMLRGPQTPGEIKSRSSRMFNFGNLTQVDDVLQKLMNREKPLIIKLPRQTGMKESRYMHILSGEPEIDTPVNEIKDISSNNDDRITKLEAEFESLNNDVNEIKTKFEKFKQQFK